MFNKLLNNVNKSFLQVEEESKAYRLANPRFDWRLLFLIGFSCLMLINIEYVGNSPGYFMLADFFAFLGLDSLKESFLAFMQENDNPHLYRLCYWVVIIIFSYLIFPILFVRFVLKDKLSEYGFSLRNALKEYRIIILFLIFMLPLVWLFSQTEGFQERYPFYRVNKGEDLWPHFWIWQIFYLFQFFALEFFFRGFLVHALKKRFGVYAVFIMVIPYCMIHFGKPMPETIAAIFAGITLGFLSLKTKSIWLGVFIHYAVAISMDLLALYYAGVI
jgi:CAAX protease family protein